MTTNLHLLPHFNNLHSHIQRNISCFFRDLIQDAKKFTDEGDYPVPLVSRQSIWETSTSHILKQGSPSIDQGACRYLSRDGRMCAAAPFLVDRNARLMADGHGIWDGVVDDLYEENSFIFVTSDVVEYRDYVRFMQEMHDVAALSIYNEGLREDKLNDTFMELYRYLVENIAPVLHVQNVQND